MSFAPIPPSLRLFREVVLPRPRDLELACPACGSKIQLPEVNGNTIATPLTCEHCGHRFRPRFYCPDRKASAYHIFETEALYVDNLDGLYTFCPEHTYTTYDLVESAIGNRRTLARSQARWRELSNVLLFRLALTLAPLRVALETLRRITWQRLFPGPR